MALGLMVEVLVKLNRAVERLHEAQTYGTERSHEELAQDINRLTDEVEELASRDV